MEAELSGDGAGRVADAGLSSVRANTYGGGTCASQASAYTPWPRGRYRFCH